MAGVNKVIIVGTLGKDPEYKKVNDSGVAKISVATSEKFNDRNGQKQEVTEWHNIVAWGKLGEIMDKYLAKGSKVYVEGKIQTRSWEDQQGNKMYATEILANNMQMLSEKKERSSASNDEPDW